jgi:hypothetical protein
MRVTSALRTPYRSSPISRRVSTRARKEEATLDRAIVLTQIVVIALCAARALTDLLGGPPTAEGAVAAALFALLTARLIAKAIGRPRRRARKAGVARQLLR